MKIKGKAIEDYFSPARIGKGAYATVRNNAVIHLKNDLEKSLDEFVLQIQTWALKVSQRKDPITYLFKGGNKEEAYKQARAYLDTVGEINRTFGTNYSQNIETIKKYLEPQTPAKD